MFVGDYIADAGGLLVGDEGFDILIPNGIGDGYYKVYVASEEELKDKKDGMKFITVIDGIFEIYDYDCAGGKVLAKIDGRYAIYRKDGNIYFEKLKY